MMFSQTSNRSIVLAIGALSLAILACGPADAIAEIIVDVFESVPTPTPDPSHTLYVSPEGDDANDCHTPASPCLRINTAVERAEAGWTIQLAPGRYDEFSYTVSTTVNIDKAILLRGSGPDNTHIVAHGGDHHVLVVGAEGTVVIEDLALEEGRSPMGTGLMSSSPVTLRNVIVQGNMCGIQSASDLVLENVQVLSNQECGIYAEQGRVTIRDSLISGNGGFGLSIAAAASGTIQNTTIRDNTPGEAAGIVNAGSARIMSSTISGNSGYGIYNRGDLDIENSTISGNRLDGIIHFGDLSIIHSTIAANQGHGLVTSPPYQNLTVANTLFANNGIRDCYLTYGWSYHYTFEGTNVDTDESCLDWPGGAKVPLAIGPLADNGGPTMTHALILGTSPIDGAREACPAADQRGIARPQGDSCDVGAFELEFSGDVDTEALSGDFPPVFPIGPTTCRSGPSIVFPPLAYFDVGDELVPLARDAFGAWLQVRGQGKPPCWVNEELLKLDPGFDLMDLPPGLIPPTPTWTAVPPTEKPDTGPQGCKVYNNQTQQEVCYPIAQCPVPFNQSLGACTP